MKLRLGLLTITSIKFALEINSLINKKFSFHGVSFEVCRNNRYFTWAIGNGRKLTTYYTLFAKIVTEITYLTKLPWVEIKSTTKNYREIKKHNAIYFNSSVAGELLQTLWGNSSDRGLPSYFKHHNTYIKHCTSFQVSILYRKQEISQTVTSKIFIVSVEIYFKSGSQFIKIISNRNGLQHLYVDMSSDIPRNLYSLGSNFHIWRKYPLISY